MAIFDTSDANVVPSSPFTPQEAVVDQSASALLQGGGALLNTAARMEGAKIKQEKATASAALLTDFTGTVSKYAKAVNQGSMTSSQAKVRINQRLNEAAAQNPDLWEDLITRRNDILSESGLGAEIRTGTVQEQAQKKLEGELYDRGIISTTTPPEEVQTALEQYQDVKRAEDQIRQAQAKSSLLSTQLGNQSQQLTMEQRLAEKKQQDGLFNYVTNYAPLFQRDLGNIMRDRQEGKISEEDALKLLEEKHSEVVTTRNLISDKVSREYVERISWGMDQIYENTRKAMTGEMTNEVLKRQNERIILLQQNDFLKDPANAASVAVQRLVPNTQMLGLTVEMNNRVLSHMKKNEMGGKPTNLFDTDPQARKDASDYLKVIQDNVDMMGRDGLDDRDQELLRGQVSNIVKGAVVYGGTAEEPSEFKPLLKFFASDQFHKVNQGEGGVPEDMAAQVGDTLFRQYEEMIIPAIKREYETGVTGGTTGRSLLMPETKGKPITDVIETSWRGGLMFRLKDGADFGALGNRAGAQAKADSLNKRVASNINELVRAQAHIQGHKNYRQVYEELYSHLFGVENPEESGAAE